MHGRIGGSPVFEIFVQYLRWQPRFKVLLIFTGNNGLVVEGDEPCGGPV
jgi:hypothetical protein